MPTPLASNTFEFADGNAGHVCSLGSAPNVGEWDVLCVNSDTTISTPSGFTAGPTAVTNQGAYVFRRKAAGGEGSTVTVTTSGNNNTKVAWSRWPTSLIAADDAKATQANSSAGNATPAHSTNVLSASGELIIAFGALHSIGTANQTAPDWGTYTALTAGAAQGSGASGVRSYVGYKSGVGTAAESPSVSWTGDGCQDRYMLTLTFTASAGTQVQGTLTAAWGGMTAAITGQRKVNAVLAATWGALTTRITGVTSGSATPTNPGAGWYKLLSIFQQQEEEDARFAEERRTNPVACPNCGLVLRSGPEGSGVRLFCPAGDFRYP